MKYQKLVIIVLAAALLGACSSNKMGKMKMSLRNVPMPVSAAVNFAV
jgi:major membrane immunogen (membrane-anchored lipoprotein)